MHPSIAGPIEARKAWEDTGSWRLVTVLETTPEGVTVDDGGVAVYLAFPASVRLSGVTGRAAFSEQRGLLALGAKTGPIIPLDPDFGVFGMLGVHDAYVFLKVKPGDGPTPDRACSKCGYPEGTPEKVLCRYHARPMDMGAMFKANHFGRRVANADGQAFAGSAELLAAALREVAGAALPLQAARLVLRYESTLDRFGDPDDRALVLTGLGHLINKAGLDDIADRFEAERANLIAAGHRVAVQPWSLSGL